MSQVLLGVAPALPGLSPVDIGASKVLTDGPKCSKTYHNHSHGTPVWVIRNPIYFEGRQEWAPRVWYSPEIDASKFTLHILSDTPEGFQWLKSIFQMQCNCLLYFTYIYTLSRNLSLQLSSLDVFWYGSIDYPVEIWMLFACLDGQGLVLFYITIDWFQWYLVLRYPFNQFWVGITTVVCSHIDCRIHYLLFNLTSAYL